MMMMMEVAGVFFFCLSVSHNYLLDTYNKLGIHFYK